MIFVVFFAFEQTKKKGKTQTKTLCEFPTWQNSKQVLVLVFASKTQQRDHTHPTANTQLPQTTHVQYDAVFVMQQLVNTADHKSAVPPRVQTSLPSAAIGCNSPLCAPAVGSSGWESLSPVVGSLSAENWHCAGPQWPWPPCRKLLCLPHPQAGWRCTCTGRAGSCASVCCCNYCCYLRRCCRHLCCCFRRSPSPSCAPLFHSSQPPEAPPARASSGQSCTTASYQVAGDFYLLRSGTAPLLLWLRVAFNAGSDDTGRFRTCCIHPHTGPPASQASPNMDTFYFPQASLNLGLCQQVSIHL